MKCKHCGLCCKDARTQINLTIGDLYRIVQHSGKSVEELFEKYVGLNPFADADIKNYDLELGLNLPCKFRKDEKCELYEARPLNCRLFPIWILADAPAEKLPKILKEHKCEWDINKKEKYKEYTKIVGDILMQESEMMNFGAKINITEIPGYYQEMIEEEKIKLIKENFGIKLPIKLIEKLIEDNKGILEKNNKELEKVDQII